MPKDVMCKQCNNLVNERCEKVIDSPCPDIKRDCQYFCQKTNADRIRSMSDEELIQLFVLEDKCPKNISSRECDGFESCKDCWVHWLKQPAEED